ncbi:hypothetical protein [Roseibacillus ishigakijimensis]|uniref:ABC-2 type transport system permease protein n=1 Tax=Roseibacillus ishigakijimensis TaxID=454146 RepID=A0A934RNR7_9BACT|nr:hypothetical protein [Roseibacillus ishigakijimensis]MBK1834203.1 hypothetical protein [Roseibacillus ishigakijimensis]
MPEESAQSAPPPLPPSPWHKTGDFSDRLSPMLVKELRQGLRTHSFVVLFLVMQGLLAFILLTTAAADTNAGEFISALIFFFFSLAALVVQPLRGISAISSEVKADTIDLMALTKLSAWRIVIGKWNAIVSQTALLLFAIVPYLILRYFFGGMQLFAELLLLGSLFFLSTVFTAITVGLSASTLALVRALPLLGGLFLVFPIGGIAFSGLDEVLEMLTPSEKHEWFALGAFYAIAAYVGYFFLELATTAIAPSAENRATRKRLVALVILPTVFISCLQVDWSLAWVLSLLLLLMLTLDLFTERADYPSIVLRPFLHFGYPGSLLARFFAPGWATGQLFFALLVGLLVALDFFLAKRPPEPDFWPVIGALLGIVLLPLALLNIFHARLPNRMAIYLLLSITLCGLFPLFEVLDNLNDSGTLLKVFAFFPHVQLLLVDDFRVFNPLTEGQKLTLTWASTTCYFLLALFFSRHALANLSRLEREEREGRNHSAGEVHPPTD